MSLERNMQTSRLKRLGIYPGRPCLEVRPARNLAPDHGPGAWPKPCVVNVNGVEVLAGSLSHHRLLAAQ